MSRRCHWGHGIAAVYTLFALGTASVVIFAMRQPVDLVSDDYYAQAVALDGRRAAEANVRALRDAFAIDATDDGHAVTIRWPLRTTAGAVGTVTLYRPADAAADRTIAMAPSPDGTQVVSLADLAPGRWTVEVAWTSGGRRYYAERPITAIPAARAPR